MPSQSRTAIQTRIVPWYPQRQNSELSAEQLELLRRLHRAERAERAGGGGQAMPDGTKPEPGGWNRFSLEVADLAAVVEELRKAGVRFRGDIVTGVGGKQILLDDPSGNPVELFEPTGAAGLDLFSARPKTDPSSKEQSRPGARMNSRPAGRVEHERSF